MDTQEENIFQRLVRESEENRVNDNAFLIQMLQALNSNLITRFQPGGVNNFLFSPAPVRFQETPDDFFGLTPVDEWANLIEEDSALEKLFKSIENSNKSSEGGGWRISEGKLQFSTNFSWNPSNIKKF